MHKHAHPHTHVHAIHTHTLSQLHSFAFTHIHWIIERENTLENFGKYDTIDIEIMNIYFVLAAVAK